MDIDEQPDEEIHRAKAGRVLRAGASVSMELGCVTHLVCGCVRHLEAHQSLWYWDFMEVFYPGAHLELRH